MKLSNFHLTSSLEVSESNSDVESPFSACFLSNSYIVCRILVGFLLRNDDATQHDVWPA